MHKYRVIEVRRGQNWLLLEGGVGHYHWARVLGELPPVGSILSGSRPHLGFGLLTCARFRLSYRLVFESINGEDRRFDLGWINEPMTTPPVHGRHPGVGGGDAASPSAAPSRTG